MVLILILLEYGLRHVLRTYYPEIYKGLNPYSIGIWSATVTKVMLPQGTDEVLILILLEYGLRRVKPSKIGFSTFGLNPYSIGIWSAT